jgi:hypothetical protein
LESKRSGNRTSLPVDRPQVCTVRRCGIDDPQSGFPPTGVQSSSSKPVIFPRQIDPTGKSLLIFRNHVKARN